MEEEVGMEVTVDPTCLTIMMLRLIWVPSRAKTSVDLNRVMSPWLSTRKCPMLINKMLTASARNKIVESGLLPEPSLRRIILTSSVRLANFPRMRMNLSKQIKTLVIRMSKKEEG